MPEIGWYGEKPTTRTPRGACQSPGKENPEGRSRPGLPGLRRRPGPERKGVRIPGPPACASAATSATPWVRLRLPEDRRARAPHPPGGPEPAVTPGPATPNPRSRNMTVGGDPGRSRASPRRRPRSSRRPRPAAAPRGTERCREDRPGPSPSPPPPASPEKRLPGTRTEASTRPRGGACEDGRRPRARGGSGNLLDLFRAG